MRTTTRLSSLLLLLGGFLALGGPLVLFVWHEVSELLMGRIHPGPLAVAAVALAALLWLAARLGRRLQSISDSLAVGVDADPRSIGPGAGNGLTPPATI